jgi:hypothetical protein
MATFKEYTFSAAETDPDVIGTVKASRVLICVTGTFSCTIKVQWEDAGGTAHFVQEDGADLSFAAAGERVLDFGVPVKVYPVCSSYTSGDAVVAIQGAVLSYP